VLSGGKWLEYCGTTVATPGEAMGPSLPSNFGDTCVAHEERPADPPPPPPVVQVPVEGRWGTATLSAIGGVRRLSVAAFDAPLRLSGYGPLPRDYPGGGFALDFSFARWRFEIPVFIGAASAPSLAGPGSVGAMVADLSFDVGYDLVRYEGLTVFAQGGFGISSLMLDTRDPHWTFIAQRTGVSSDVSTVEQDTFIFDGQLGIEELVPLGRAGPAEMWGLTLSLRGGYEQQIANGGWQTSGSPSTSVGGLPLVDLSGGWLALGIGFGVYAAAPKSVGYVAPP
jgi:hypothetical protein